MLPSEGSEILRVAILSGVIGFAGFCVSYGFLRLAQAQFDPSSAKVVGNRRTV